MAIFRPMPSVGMVGTLIFESSRRQVPPSYQTGLDT
jgi:hypothetical protein